MIVLSLRNIHHSHKRIESDLLFFSFSINFACFIHHILNFISYISLKNIIYISFLKERIVFMNKIKITPLYAILFLTFFGQDCIAQDDVIQNQIHLSQKDHAPNAPSLSASIGSLDHYFSNLALEEDVQIISAEDFSKYFDAYFGMIHKHLRLMVDERIDKNNHNKITQILQTYYHKCYKIYLEARRNSLDLSRLNKDLQKLIPFFFPGHKKGEHFQIESPEEASTLLEQLHETIELN